MLQQALALPERQPDPAQILLGQLGEDVEGNLGEGSVDVDGTRDERERPSRLDGPHEPHARRIDEGDRLIRSGLVSGHGAPLDDDYRHSSYLRDVSYNRAVLEKMIEARPELKYFNDTYNRDEYALFDFELAEGQYFGEDYTFCRRARANGFTIFVDPEITLPHVGSQEYHRSFKDTVLMPLIEQHCTPKLKVVNG
jgi:hypothetical protein